MTDNNKYKPVAFDPKAYAASKSTSDPEFKVAYDALQDEFATLMALFPVQRQVSHRLKWLHAWVFLIRFSLALSPALANRTTLHHSIPCADMQTHAA